MDEPRGLARGDSTRRRDDGHPIESVATLSLLDEFVPARGRPLLWFELMTGLRKFIRSRRSGAALAVCIAYLLAIQAFVASIGLGMSALAASGPDGSAICSFASRAAPTPTDHRQKPHPAPQCPFCFVAGQSAGHIALLGPAQAPPAYAGVLLGTVSDRADDTFVPPFRRTVGNPRAPPVFSA
jgi:hypothetical protein